MQETSPLPVTILGADTTNTYVNKFGANRAVGTTEEVVWTAGGEYNWKTSASVVNVVSTSANDAAAGTHCQKARVYGLDGSYNEVNELVTMNGQTPVATTASFLRVFRVVCEDAGATGDTEANDGVISVYTGTATAGVPDDSLQVYAQVAANDGQTLMAVYTVPDGYTAYFTSYTMTAGDGKNTTGSLYIREPGKCRNVKDTFDFIERDISRLESEGLTAPEHTDIWMSAFVDVGTTLVSARFVLLLVAD